jgi:hypothetical protein
VKNCKKFEDEFTRLVSKTWADFVKNDINDHIVNRPSPMNDTKTWIADEEVV